MLLTILTLAVPADERGSGDYVHVLHRGEITILRGFCSLSVFGPLVCDKHYLSWVQGWMVKVVLFLPILLFSPYHPYTSSVGVGGLYRTHHMSNQGVGFMYEELRRRYGDDWPQRWSSTRVSARALIPPTRRGFIPSSGGACHRIGYLYRVWLSILRIIKDDMPRLTPTA